MTYYYIIKYLLITNLICLIQTRLPCQFPLKTYKKNCTIFYQHCNQSKDLINCTLSTCIQTNLDNQCIAWNSVTKTPSECLYSCCSDFQPNIQYTYQNLKLCIERDAKTQNTINMGLTFGLILSLLVVLFLGGFACLLAIVCSQDNKESQEDKKNQNQGLGDKKTQEIVHINLGLQQ